MNGDTVLHKELANNLSTLESCIPPKGCEMGYKVKSALIRCLLICDHLLSMQKINTIILVIVLLFVAKAENKNIFEFILSLVK